MASAEHVIVTDEDYVRTIRLRRPQKKNALTQAMYTAMSRAIDTAQNNPEIRCLLITGGSGVFTAGNDIGDYIAASPGRDQRPRHALKFMHSLVHNAKPLIAAVDGVAIGIGTVMLFHCDYVLASTAASFSTPFIQFAVVPEGASSLLMPLAMGHQRAFAMLAMGRSLDAEAARTAGFVNEVVAPGHAETEARKAAREICALSPEAVAITRKLLRLPPEEMVRRIDQEGHLFGERMQSPEAVAAFDAFLAHRKR
jgi:enoyl-CoA hydratase/carnithine racemase